jgi:hypothetical protein
MATLYVSAISSVRVSKEMGIEQYESIRKILSDKRKFFLIFLHIGDAEPIRVSTIVPEKYVQIKYSAQHDIYDDSWNRAAFVQLSRLISGSVTDLGTIDNELLLACAQCLRLSNLVHPDTRVVLCDRQECLREYERRFEVQGRSS